MLKKFWIAGVLLIALFAVSVLIQIQSEKEKEPIKSDKPVEVETPVAPKPPPPGESAESGHWHGDEWHSEPHETHAPPAVPAVENTVPPGAVTTPDFPPVDPNADPVAEAYKRLEYIKNNPYAWGGVHSERATELLAQLLPPPYLVDHDHSDEVTLLIDELCQQGDPRAAEALIAIMSDGGIMGRIMFDTLAEIGPPAVPYVLPYLLTDDRKGETWIPVNLAVFDALGRIGVKYRADLGGILDHIIIPKLKEIAADENNEHYYHVTVTDARELLTRLGR